jgi:glycosyltransferase involved in cell wall biosynthesis
MREEEAAPEFSIVIPAYNEEAVIGKCLGSIAALEGGGVSFEVIVVDNGSRDRTVEVARSYADRMALQVMVRPGIRISAMRNAGAAAARGKYLSFLDSDMEVRGEWLRKARKILEAPGRRLIGAEHLVPPGSGWMARLWYQERSGEKRGAVSYNASGNMMMTREGFEEIGGFDERIETNEDFEICQRAREAGWEITAHPEIATVHWGTPQTLKAFFRQQRWHGKNVLQVFLADPERRRNRKVVVFAAYTLAAAAAVGISMAVGVATGWWWMTGASVCLLAGPPLLLGLKDAPAPRALKLLPLAFLYLLYGLARAQTLLSGAAHPGKDYKKAMGA